MSVRGGGGGGGAGGTRRDVMTSSELCECTGRGEGDQGEML